MKRSALLFLALVFLFPPASAGSDRYDPRLRFRTISTERFDIHFHQGEEEEARRLAIIAEDVAARLDETLGRASGRVQVILVNQSDVSNGWATPLPFNTIEITAASPGGAAIIGNTDDWLRLVFTHEYTHIVHLSRGRGWSRGLRRVLGRHPLLYPNLYLPLWQIEGLATYEESALTGLGRIRDGSFRSILDTAAARARFEPLDRVGGGLVDWPGGHAPYLYGGFFHEFLRGEYGDDSLARLVDATAGRLPYFGAPAFRKVFGKPLGALWEDFADVRPETTPAFGPAVRRLTHHGFSVYGPRFAPDGRLFYSIATPHAFPDLRVLIAAGASQHVANRYPGRQIAFAGSRLIFDAMEVESQVALQSDLHAISSDGTQPRRLTSGARASEPDVAPDGRTVVVTVQRADRRDLATAELRADGTLGPLEVVASERLVHYSSPRWSHDGRFIAAEGRFGEIVLVDAAARKVARSLRPDVGGRAVTPAWMPDGSLLFASDIDGAGFRLHRMDVQSLEVRRLEGTGPDARSPDISPDGRTLVYVGSTPDGYDLFALPLDRAEWSAPLPPGQRAGGRSPRLSDQSALLPLPDLRERSYSPGRTLAPRFWTPLFDSDNDEIRVGAATWSGDALGRHSYAAQAAWSPSRARPDWTVSYVYDRWRPSFFVSVTDEIDPFRDGELRTREANAGVLVPVRRVRWTQSLLGAVHASTDDFVCSDCPAADGFRRTRRALRAGWNLHAARSFGYSISREEGWTITTTAEFPRDALGSDGDAASAVLDLRGYFPVRPAHAVLAVRAAAASARGDERVRRLFSASGPGPQPGGFRFESDAIGLLRGVSEDELLGRHAVVVNLDYRVPLMRIDRGAGTLPIFARALHGAIFMDAGHAWDARFHGAEMTVAVGAELSIDAILGYTLPITLTTGAAWASHDRGFSTFGRIGRAF